MTVRQFRKRAACRFAFVHLVDAFIQSDLHFNQDIHLLVHAFSNLENQCSTAWPTEMLKNKSIWVLIMWEWVNKDRNARKPPTFSPSDFWTAVSPGRWRRCRWAPAAFQRARGGRRRQVWDSRQSAERLHNALLQWRGNSVLATAGFWRLAGAFYSLKLHVGTASCFYICPMSVTPCDATHQQWVLSCIIRDLL